MKVILGADHAGVKMKEKLKKFLVKQGFEIDDVGSFSSEAGDDYPDFAFDVADKVAYSRDENKGILVCGSGTGMVIAANKVKGIRAAMGYDEYSAKMSREHNDSNVLCLRTRKFSFKKNQKIVKAWLSTSFSNAARHKRRVDKISKYERKRR